MTAAAEKRKKQAPAPQKTEAPEASGLTDYDLYLFSEGTHDRIYEKLGAHLEEREGKAGTRFAVWAPNAREVYVLGDFNGWRWKETPLHSRGSSGVWEAFVPGVGKGTLYKYGIISNNRGYRTEKSDPFATACELRPRTASKVWPIDGYGWKDAEWMSRRAAANRLDAPVSVYEVHLGSWLRVPEEHNRWLTYRELGPKLAEYAAGMGYTHVELMPIAEHPLDGSWGYQVVGYFAPTSRFGTPQDFMAFVDTLHQHGLGVILDWVPAHFPTDAHGLAYFDGTHLFEHADPRKGQHQDWGTLIFNYGRREVSNFLISNALFWLDKYHIDGLRVDAVASMIYLDYSRKEGEWVPNEHGGRENLEALAFLRRLNERVYAVHPDTVTIAEESTAWPMVSRPTYLGGLGFGMKWDMGWMHDTLNYLSKDPIHRKYHQNDLTFRMLYAFTENFVLPLSHDEAVHGKGSLISRMPGDAWQRFANLRLLFGYMYTQPGKKLLFMGGEFGQESEWNHEESLQWHLLEDPFRAGVQRWVRDLNHLYRQEPPLHEKDVDPSGFAWVDARDAEQCVLAWLRRGHAAEQSALVVCNFTPMPRHGYRLGVPAAGYWQELANSDSSRYGGGNIGNFGGVMSAAIPSHGHAQSVSLTLPPLGILVMRCRQRG